MRNSAGVVERVTDFDADGRIHTHYGVPVSRGPGMYRMMLTWPATEEGKIVEIPRARIQDIALAQPGTRGDMPKVLVPVVV